MHSSEVTRGHDVGDARLDRVADGGVQRVGVAVRAVGIRWCGLPEPPRLMFADPDALGRRVRGDPVDAADHLRPRTGASRIEHLDRVQVGRRRYADHADVVVARGDGARDVRAVARVIGRREGRGDAVLTVLDGLQIGVVHLNTSVDDRDPMPAPSFASVCVLPSVDAPTRLTPRGDHCRLKNEGGVCSSVSPGWYGAWTVKSGETYATSGSALSRLATPRRTTPRSR